MHEHIVNRMYQILASTTRTGSPVRDLSCNLGSLGKPPRGDYASLQVGASLTFRETHGRKPFGSIKEDTICRRECQEERLTCIDLHNFMEDYEEKYELLNNPLLEKLLHEGDTP